MTIYPQINKLGSLYNTVRSQDSKQPNNEQFIRKRVNQGNQYQEENKIPQKVYKRKQIYEVQKQESYTSPSYILQNYSQQLTKYERQEILLYKNIYYFGQNCSNKTDTIFTNDKNEYQPVLRDHIAYRYELLKLIGSGSFGQIYKVFDHKKQHIIALKTLKNTKQYSKQGKIEIDMLKKLRQMIKYEDSCVIQILSYGQFRDHIYFTMPELYEDTYTLLGKYNYKGIPQQIYLQISKDCMKGLAQLQQCEIISADIKPENILLKNSFSYRAQIIDIGTGCFVGKQAYQYIQSRYYRAPEVILGMYYSTQIDVWSLGCTFAEFVTGQPLFEGNDQIDQFGKIVEVLGLPSQQYIENSPNKDKYFKKQNGQYILKSNHKSNSRNLEQILQSAPKQYIQIIKQMLQYEPEKRLNPLEFNWDQHFQNNEQIQVEDEKVIQLPQLIQNQDSFKIQ